MPTAMTRYARYKKTFNTETIFNKKDGSSKGDGNKEVSKKQQYHGPGSGRSSLGLKDIGGIKGRPRDQARRERKLVCFVCRKVGHSIKFCPELRKENAGQAANTNIPICYHCGDDDHRTRDCPLPKEDQTFRFASCFICKQKGHLSGQCPMNKKGIYPKGGSCKICGSVYHLVKDCDQVRKPKDDKKQSGKHIITLGVMDPMQGGDDDDHYSSLMNRQPSSKPASLAPRAAPATASFQKRSSLSTSGPKPVKKKPKVVSF